MIGPGTGVRGLSGLRGNRHAQLCGDHDYAESRTLTCAFPGLTTSVDST